MLANKSILISEKEKKQFLEKGYLTFENVIPTQSLEMLRKECDRLTAETDAQLERDGIDIQPIGIGLAQRKRNYFFSAYKKSEKLKSFIFSDLTEEICRAFLGETAFLYYETFIVKYPKVGLPFSWHQDSAYVEREHKPFITLWCTLDDVSDANGTLRVLPYDKAGTKERQPHILVNPPSPQKVGYFGNEPGEPIEMPAGSIAVLSSTTFHHSGPNISEHIRRVYLMAYSVEPILSDDDDTKLKAMAETFLKDGVRVA
jgi:ectoine hydroxylase-related dioxygenase (phytanoyl-CoA dioxygenase family)